MLEQIVGKHGDGNRCVVVAVGRGIVFEVSAIVHCEGGDVEATTKGRSNRNEREAWRTGDISGWREI